MLLHLTGPRPGTITVKAIWVFTIPHQTQVLLLLAAVAELGNKLLLV
jgi:hypothetical protein